LFPSVLPYLMTGIRLSMGVAWLVIVAAEMLTGGVGIGFFIWDAWNSSKLSDIIVALVYIGFIGFVLDRLIAGLATIVTRGTAAN
ncbi:MAG: ABC transporter permease subunit, partial [Phreatobacter sp.]|uniref:ABC transporter permease subunit n=1 Tax=Phreatobacter sp. TaxID=1966341 RepID=UPI002734D8A7